MNNCFQYMHAPISISILNLLEGYSLAMCLNETKKTRNFLYKRLCDILHARCLIMYLNVKQSVSLLEY